MEWPSEELKNYFYFLDKVYSATLKQKYPYILSITIEPEEFLEQVSSSKWGIDIKAYLCIDWQLQREKYPDSNGLGEDTVKVMMNLQKMFEVPKEIGDKKIYPSIEINKKEYCEGIIKFYND